MRGAPVTRIRAVDASDQKIASILIWLQLETLPADPLVNPVEGGYWWLVFDGVHPVAYLGLTPVESWGKTGYVARVGVLPAYRGQKLQQRLLRVCERKAKAVGWQRLISTTYNNPPSANSFIACGYRTYEPAGRWGADDTIYWLKEI